MYRTIVKLVYFCIKYENLMFYFVLENGNRIKTKKQNSVSIKSVQIGIVYSKTCSKKTLSEENLLRGANSKFL